MPSIEMFEKKNQNSCHFDYEKFSYFFGRHLIFFVYFFKPDFLT